MPRKLASATLALVLLTAGSVASHAESADPPEVTNPFQTYAESSSATLSQARTIIASNGTDTEIDKVATAERAGIPRLATGFDRSLSSRLAKTHQEMRSRGSSVAISDLKAAIGSDHQTVVVDGRTAELRILEDATVTGVPRVEDPSTLDARMFGGTGGLILPTAVSGPFVSGLTRFGGSCGVSAYAPNNYGAVHLCWNKYQVGRDNSTTYSFFPYSGTIDAIPAAWNWSPDPWVKYARVGSQMTQATRTNLSFSSHGDLTAHDPSYGELNKNCVDISIGVAYASASLGINGLKVCDIWRPYVSKSIAYKTVTFDTGWVGNRGRDEEVGHTVMWRAKERPSNVTPYFWDTAWSQFCYPTDNQKCRTATI